MPFKKGQSGNPAGRKKGSGHKQQIAKLIEECGWTDKRIVEKFEQFINTGNYQAFKDFMQYKWGAIPKEILLGNADDEGLNIKVEFIKPDASK